MKRIGLDVGSTTIKCVVLDDGEKILYSDYRRHYSHIKDNLIQTLKTLKEKNIITDKARIWSLTT
jgi:activator of 2-hydroxyglutaryl-CoA dehydratase